MLQTFANEINTVMPAAIETGLCVSFCTIQEPSGNLGPSGAPDNTFLDIAGLVLIPCMDAVPSDARIQATEKKSPEQILAEGWRHIFLTGYYPQIIPGVDLGWRAIVDGTIYDLLGAEPDSQGTQTRLHLRLASV